MTKNMFKLLPIEVQNLIYEYSGNYRDIMKNVLQHIIQYGYKKLLNKTFTYTNYVTVCDNIGRMRLKANAVYNYEVVCRNCIECNKRRIILENYHLSLHSLLCSNKCKDKFLNQYSDLLEHENEEVFKRDNYYLVLNFDLFE